MNLELENICKNFGEKQVLKGINLKATSGQALGLLGRNGAGKTTTIRIIMGIFRQDSGTVLMNEGAKIGYMPEERGLYPKKNILEQMVYLGQLRGLSAKEAKARSHILLEQLEATEHIDKRLDNLSKGNQQKIQLAIAVINDPDIVILDEPFSGLDPVNSALLKQMIEGLVKQNKIVLFSSHQMSYVEEFCRHICIIKDGEIILDGMLDEIKRSYPRNKVLVVPEKAEDTDRLQAALTPLAELQPANRGFICGIQPVRSSDRLMAALVEQKIPVERFEIIEPTLEEIFVEKAGEQCSE